MGSLILILVHFHFLFFSLFNFYNFCLGFQLWSFFNLLENQVGGADSNLLFSMFLLESLGREQNAPLKSSIFDLWKFGDVASFLPDEAQRHGWNIANKKILFSVKRLFPCLACKVLKWTAILIDIHVRIMTLKTYMWFFSVANPLNF